MSCEISYFSDNYTARFNKVERGDILVSRPSVCLSVRPSVDKIVSALYLPQYWLDPFHICTSYQATSEGVSDVKVIVKFPNSQNAGALVVLSSYTYPIVTSKWNQTLATGWEVKILSHLPKLGSLLYSLYKTPLAQACFPLARPNFHSHWWAGER